MADLRQAVRSLAHAPGFALVALLTLSFGIGACTAVFTVLHGILFPTVPYLNPDRLAVLYASNSPDHDSPVDLLVRDQLELWRSARLPGIRSSAAFSPAAGVIQNRGQAFRSEGAYVQASFFDVLGVPARLGHTISKDDESKPSEAVVVLSDPLWRTKFSGANDVLGQTVRIGNVPHVVIGVMPARFNYPRGARYWASFPSNPENVLPVGNLVARLGDQATLATVAAQVKARSRTAWLNDSTFAGGFGTAVVPFGSMERGVNDDALRIAAAGIGIVFLIALLNLVVLFLVRASGRFRELGIRCALGATPWRALKPQLAEAGLIASGGMLGGIAIAAVLARIAQAALPDYAMSATPLLDIRILAFAVVLTGVTAFGLGVAPAGRLGGLDLRMVLHSSSPGMTTSKAERRARGGLVALQIALVLVLAGATGVLAKSLVNYRNHDIGYEVERVAQLRPDYDENWTDGRQRLLGQSLLERYEGRADVESAAIWRMRSVLWPPPPVSQFFGLDGHDLPSARRDILYFYHEVSPAFFQTYGIPVVRGRAFTESDGPNEPAVAVVNETAGRAWWPGADPLGKRVRIGGSTDSEWLTIVGIVRAKQGMSFLGRTVSMKGRQTPQLYRPIAQAGDVTPSAWSYRRCFDCARLTFAARTTGDLADARRLAQAMTVDLDQLAPDLPVMQGGAAIDIQMGGYEGSGLRRSLRLQAGFAIFALGLALLGVYGVVAEAAARRSKELGIRRALGASAANLVALLVRESLLVCATGIGTGLLFLFWSEPLTRLVLARQGAALVGTNASDPSILVPVAAMVMVVALLTSVLGARRAAQVDPRTVLTE